MPVENSRKNLGSLFGGEIMTLNYNFQAGSESSSCTLTLISKNNEFLEPKMTEVVTLPPFGIQMSVISTSIKKDPNFSVLQVELVDSLSDILDKELVLIYGEHTDLDYNLNNSGYFIAKSLFVPRDDFPSNKLINRGIRFPQVSKNIIKNYGDGINVIGFPRTTFKDKTPMVFTLDPDAEEDFGDRVEFQGHQWITFDARELNKELSSHVLIDDDLLGPIFNSLPLDANNADLKFGYTLKNLRDLITSKGISFEEKSFQLLNDENVLFSDSGNLRSVLTSTLSKVGKSFYVHPLTQKIHVLTNNDIASINRKLNDQYLNFENTEAAEQLNLSKSIKEVSANHVIVKGKLDADSKQFEGEDVNVPSRLRKHIFKKIPTAPFLGSFGAGITDTELNLLSIVAPYYFVTEFDKEATDRFIFALPLTKTASFANPQGIQDTEEWGDLYGAKEYTLTKNSFIPKKNSAWIRDLKSNPDFSFDGFNLNNCEEAILLKGADRKTAISASESGYLDLISSITQFYHGIYLGSPISQSRIERRSYERSSEISFIDPDAKVLEQQEFAFLGPIFEKIRSSRGQTDFGKNMKIRDLAKITNVRQAVANELYPVFVNPINAGAFFTGEEIAEFPFKMSVIENVYKFTGKTGRFLPFDKAARSIITNIANACKRSFNRPNVENKLTFKYLAVESDSSFDDQSEDTEVPEFFSIKSIPSNTKLFSKRELNPFSSGYSETQLFIQNMNELSPQFQGPFIATNVNYYRPPTRDDFDMENGVNSVSVTVGSDGISTAISYSSKKFAKVDTSIMTDFLGERSINFLKQNRFDAWKRNRENL